MMKNLQSIFEYFETKVAAAAVSLVFSDDLLILLVLFLVLEVLDIFTRCIAESARLYKDMYNKTADLYTYCLFLRQAHRFRYIHSRELRHGFLSKMLTYMLLLLLAATTDAALSCAQSQRIALTVVVTILATTELLSSLENLNEANVSITTKVLEKLRKKVE